ncbi:MAG: VWA domain-containing protein [Candidatus Cloacimonetes bacterium]|nr:VWA domain-containing protein [Candidatus Cloacimonadota bacterium]
MRWGNPQLLFLLIIIPLLLLTIFWTKNRRKKRIEKFADRRFFDFFTQEFHSFYWELKAVLLVIALAFLIIAISLPQWNKEIQMVKKEGIDIVVCIDVSKSMDAQDIRPSRIERAKDQISLFIDQLKGDRIALVAFAGRSFVSCPLTDDYGAAKLFLNLLDTESAGYYGTNIGDALQESVSLFRESQKYKIIVLISDGEDLESKSIEVAQEISKQGVVIYALGVGSPEGSTIPLVNQQGNVEYAKDENGNIILSKLDVVTLSKLASAGNGKFYSVTPQQSEIFEIMKDINSIEREKIDSREFVRYKEQYRYFSLIALILIILESLIYYKRNVKFKRNIEFQE